MHQQHRRTWEEELLDDFGGISLSRFTPSSTDGKVHSTIQVLPHVLDFGEVDWSWVSEKLCKDRVCVCNVRSRHDLNIR
jgi:hypothetical protein